MELRAPSPGRGGRWGAGVLRGRGLRGVLVMKQLRWLPFPTISIIASYPAGSLLVPPALWASRGTAEVSCALRQDTAWLDLAF